MTAISHDGETFNAWLMAITLSDFGTYSPFRYEDIIPSEIPVFLDNSAAVMPRMARASSNLCLNICLSFLSYTHYTQKLRKSKFSCGKCAEMC